MPEQLYKHLRSPSAIAGWITALIVIYSLFNISQWKNHNVLRDDVCGYYSFLPAFFIYDDLRFEFDEPLREKYGNMLWTALTEDGKVIQKYPVGPAVMNMPFFLAAHLLAQPLGYPADGYSIPYQMAIALAGGIYMIIGLFFLRRLLLKYYSETITTIVLLSVVFGTNLYYYSTTESAMSHAYSFCLFAAFLLFSLRWYRQPDLKIAAATGLLAGMIIITRPTNVLVFLVPLLYGIDSFSSLGKRTGLFRQHAAQLGIMFLCLIVAILPQLLYWKYATSQWVYYSYVGDHFFFDRPHIIDGLFSYRKGWLLYTPLMVFVFPGIFLLKGKAASFRLSIGIFLVLSIYVIFSWWCWWYGGSFGARPLVEAYAVLALPLAAVFEAVNRLKKGFHYAGLTLLTTLIALNLFQTQQKRIGVLHYDSMTAEVYWKVFGRLEFPPDFWYMIQPPDYSKARKGEKEMLNRRIKRSIPFKTMDFNKKDYPHNAGRKALSAPYSLQLDSARPYSPSLLIPFEEFPDLNASLYHLRASVHYFPGQLSRKTEVWMVIQFNEAGKDPFYHRIRSLVIPGSEQNKWQLLTFEVPVPQRFSQGHVAQVFLYNTSGTALLIDDLKVELLEMELY